MGGAPGALHAAAAEVLAMQAPCGFSAFHTGSRARAWLRLNGVTERRPVEDPRWEPHTPCDQAPAEPYGQRMPLSAGRLEERDLAPVRDWICAGAPGP